MKHYAIGNAVGSYRTRHGLNENIREIVCVCVSTFDNLFFFMNETLCNNTVGSYRTRHGFY